MAAPEGADIFYQDFIDQEELIQANGQLTEMQSLYEGATIFVTGGTGFMGRILIEKLLRSCYNLNKIYMLIRPKKGKEMEERFTEYFKDVIFEPLHSKRPGFPQKVVPISGDCALPGLGISNEDREKIKSEVSLIFHGAATVRFDEKLRTAVNINIKGTKEILDLARETKNLKAVIHISTAYSNCVQKEIHEKFYKPPMTYKHITQLIEVLDDSALEILTPKLLGNWPNTYTYTKIIAEDVVREFGKGLPVAMIRPSIVTSTSREPIVGWINNFYGPQGVVFGAGVGLLRTLHCDGEVLADMVPVDLVINAVLALAWDIAQTRGDNPNFEKIDSKEAEINNHDSAENEDDEPSDIPVLNYVSAERNPIKWNTFMRYNSEGGQDIPSMRQLWYYGLRLNKSYYAHLFYRFWLHIVPAIIVDTILRIRGKKPMLLDGYRKIHKFSKVISHFSTNQWKFRDDNTWKLYDKISPKDRKLFDFNIGKLDWEEYFHRYIRGLRIYMAQDPISTIPQAKKRYQRIKYAHFTILTVSYLLMAYLAWWFIHLFV